MASNTVARKFNQPCLYLSQKTPIAPKLKAKNGGQGQFKRGRHTRQPEARAHAISQPSETDEDASAHFHISIGWTLEKPLQGRPEEATVDVVGQAPLDLGLHVQTMKVKVGNGIVVIPLLTKAVESNGIAGT